MLAADSGVQSILLIPRTDNTTAMWPGQAPEGYAPPFLVYGGVHEQDEMSFDGVDPFTGARLELFCYGGNYADAKRLARTIRKVLEPFNDDGQHTLSEGTVVQGMHRIGEHDVFEYAPQLYLTVIEFQIHFQDVGS